MRSNARQDTRNAKRKRQQGSALSSVTPLGHASKDMAVQMKVSAHNGPNTTLNNHKHSKRISCETKDPGLFELKETNIKDADFGKLAQAQKTLTVAAAIARTSLADAAIKKNSQMLNLNPQRETLQITSLPKPVVLQ